MLRVRVRGTAPFVEFDPLHGANIAIADVCGIAPGAPTGGCDAPHPESITVTRAVTMKSDPNLFDCIFWYP
ncbi:MAG: hypothetical protein ABSD52_11435 [Candidatus Cybelea sp.]